MFDALPETRGNGKTLRSRFLSTAVAAHGLLLAVIVGGSFLARVDAGEDPPRPYEIYHVTTMELPQGDTPFSGGGGSKHDKQPPAPEKAPEPVVDESPVQPQIVDPLPEPETEPQTEAPTSEPVVDEPGPGGTDDDGTGTGHGGGDGPGKGPGRGPGNMPGDYGDPNGTGHDMPEDPGIVIPGGEVQAPLLIHRVEPEYPEVARNAHKEGDVILQIVVGTDGKVESVKVLRSEPLLDRAATRAVAQWIYRPSILHGRHVKVYVTVFVSFRLN